MAFTKTYRITSTQTVFDVATQLLGDADKAFDLMENNPEIENINSDPSGVTATYEINNTATQKYYISKGITVAMKPMEYNNSLDDALLVSPNVYLVQNDGYRILM